MRQNLKLKSWSHALEGFVTELVNLIEFPILKVPSLSLPSSAFFSWLFLSVQLCCVVIQKYLCISDVYWCNV